LAESFYASNKFDQALSGFAEVIEKYPSSSKVPDALLKMGYCNYSLKRWDAARAALTRVQAEYPTTTAARLADQYLKRMQSEGV
jgi:TolA-binding protein